MKDFTSAIDGSTVTVNISSADTGEITVSPSSLSFSTSNYSVAQTVTMTGVNDNVSDGNQSIAITNSIASSDSDYAALDNQTVTAVNVDDDTVAMTVSNLSTSSFREIANSSVIATDNYTIVLGSQPSSDVIDAYLFVTRSFFHVSILINSESTSLPFKSRKRNFG